MNFPKVKPWTGQPVRYLQEKLDGYALVVTDHVALSRKRDVDYWSKLPNHLRRLLSLPQGTTIMGELWWDGPATSIPTLLNDSDPRLQFTAFAIPTYGGEPVVGRYLEVMQSLQGRGFHTPKTEPFFQFQQTTEEWIRRLNQFAVKRGIEGYILKQDHMEGWYKVKPKRTIDCVVVGYTLSTSMSFAGGLKAIQVAVEGKEIASIGSGFTADYRMEVDPKKLIGRLCEIEYDSIAANGRLKFPRFLRWRYDK